MNEQYGTASVNWRATIWKSRAQSLADIDRHSLHGVLTFACPMKAAIKV